MNKNLSLIVKKLISILNPISIYLYGNSIRSDSKDSSDIDILIIMKDDKIDFEKLKELTEENPCLDLTIITIDEIRNGAHASFNSFYYINLLFSSILLYGEDILIKEFEKYPNFNSAVWRVQCIMQRIRNTIANKRKENEIKYWFDKFNHWLYLVMSEFLFFTKGYYNPNLEEAKHKFESLFFNIKVDDTKDLYSTFSRIKELYLKNFHRNIRVRPGVFAIIKQNNKYILFQRRDGKGFEFVKGGVEEGEDFSDAAIRELKEEIGINVNKKDLIQTPVTLSFKYPLKDGYEIRIYKGFILNKKLKNFKFGDFFKSVKTFDIDEIRNVITFSEYYESILKIKEYRDAIK